MTRTYDEPIGPGNQCGFLGTPRGLGLATATTSLAFLPHVEQRFRLERASNLSEQHTRGRENHRHAERESRVGGEEFDGKFHNHS